MLNVLNDNADLQLLENSCTLYKKDDIKKIKNVEIKELCETYDYVIEINDYDVFIKNSKISKEISKIKKLKIDFTNFNNSYLRENAVEEIDDLEETCDREILNRPLIRRLKNRGIHYTNKDAIYLTNKQEESYQKIKSCFLNISLSWQYNDKFEEITRRLKLAIPSQKQQYTIFHTIWLSSFRDTENGERRKVCVIIPELTFNNEAFNKNLYKLFAPYTAQLMCDATIIKCPNVSRYESFPVVCAYDDRVVDIQRL